MFPAGQNRRKVAGWPQPGVLLPASAAAPPPPGAQGWGSRAEPGPSAGALVPASVSSPFLLLSRRRAGGRSSCGGAVWGWGTDSPGGSRRESGGAAASWGAATASSGPELQKAGVPRRGYRGLRPAPLPPALAPAATPSLFLGLWGRVAGSREWD